MMGTLYPHPMIPPEQGRTIFQYSASYLTQGDPDLLIGNLEGAITDYPLTTKNTSSGRNFAFRMPPYMAAYLYEAGFDVVSTANNHALDFGATGYADTRKHLQAAGVGFVGDKREVWTGMIHNRKVALVAFTWGNRFNNILDIETSRVFLQELSLSNDILIVTFHGGSEGDPALQVRDQMEYLYGNPRGNVVQFSRMAIESGADLVLGHGPHLPRSLELYQGRLVAYSLGNFATYRMFNTSGPRKYTLVLSVDLNPDGTFSQARILPLIQRTDGAWKGVPVPDPQSNSIFYIREKTSQDFPDTPLVIDDSGLVRAVSH